LERLYIINQHMYFQGGINIHLSVYIKPVEGDLVLPVHYNHLVQAVIYNYIDEELAEFLSNKGYTEEKTPFKMFAFSRLRGMYAVDKNNNSIRFVSEIELTISSPVDRFCQWLSSSMLTQGSMKLGESEVVVSKVYSQKFKVEKEIIAISTLSPIVLYGTAKKPDGKRQVSYFRPGDANYDRLLNRNLQKKYRAFYGADPPAGEVRAKAIGRQRISVVNYKKTVIKGYSGRLLLTGPVDLLQLAVDGGLGSINAKGFGCVEIAEGVESYI